MPAGRGGIGPNIISDSSDRTSSNNSKLERVLSSDSLHLDSINQLQIVVDPPDEPTPSDTKKTVDIYQSNSVSYNEENETQSTVFRNVRLVKTTPTAKIYLGRLMRKFVIIKTFLPPTHWTPTQQDYEVMKQVMRREAERISLYRSKRLGEIVGIIPESMTVVMEYFPGGSLEDFIKKYPTMRWRDKYSVICDVASGVHYLHEDTICTGDATEFTLYVQLYRNLTSANVMLFKFENSIRAKIIDYSFHEYREHLRGKQPLTAENMGKMLPYTAPEVIENPTKLSKKSDVYSFGVLLFELCLFETPTAPITRPQQHLRNGRYPSFYVELMLQCMHPNPKSRPDFPIIMDKLKENQNRIKMKNEKDDREVGIGSLRRLSSIDNYSSTFDLYQPNKEDQVHVDSHREAVEKRKQRIIITIIFSCILIIVVALLVKYSSPSNSPTFTNTLNSTYSNHSTSTPSATVII